MPDEMLDAIRHRTNEALRQYKSKAEGGTNDGYYSMHGYRVARDIQAMLDGEIPSRCESCGNFLVTCENPHSAQCVDYGCNDYKTPVVKSSPEEEPPEGWATCYGCFQPIEGARDTVMEVDNPEPPRRWHGLCYRVVHSPLPI